MQTITQIAVFIIFYYLMVSCQGLSSKKEDSKENLLATIKPSIEKYLKYDSLYEKPDKLNEIDTLTASIFKFASYFPKEETCAELLYKGAIIEMKRRNYKTAVSLLQQAVNNYLNWKERAEAIFLLAFIYDEFVKNYSDAKKYYNMVIKEYPESEYAHQAKNALKILEMPEDKLIQKISS